MGTCQMQPASPIVFAITKGISIKLLASISLAAIALGAVVSGCGGGGDSASGAGGTTHSVEAATTMTTGSLSKAQFIAHLNQLCGKEWAEIRQNFRQYSSWQDPRMSEKKRFGEAIQLSLLAGIDFHIFDNIRLIGAPEGEESQIEEIIGPMQYAVETGQQRVMIYSPAQLWALFGEYNQRAGRYGLDACLVNEAHARL